MLLTDVDDVLLKWADGFKLYLRSIGVKYGPNTSWNLRDWVRHPDPMKLATEFNSSPLFTCLDPVDGAVVGLKRLKEKYRFVAAITCCGKTNAPARACNLAHVFGRGVIDEIICLDLGSPKDAALRYYPSGAVWVEDNREGCLAGVAAGHRGYLINKPYNKGHSSLFTRVSGWEELLQKLV